MLKYILLGGAAIVLLPVAGFVLNALLLPGWRKIDGRFYYITDEELPGEPDQSRGKLPERRERPR